MEKKRRVSEEKGKRRSQRGVWGERNCTAAPGPWMLLCKVICQAAGWRGRAYVIRGAVGAKFGAQDELSVAVIHQLVLIEQTDGLNL